MRRYYQKRYLSGVPPKVEYELTDIGRSVLPIVLDIAQWGIKIANPLNQKK